MAPPREIRVRSYQVGFGDCYLLTFRYRTVERHVLIDCGSTGKPAELRGTLQRHLRRVAEHVAETGDAIHRAALGATKPVGAVLIGSGDGRIGQRELTEFVEPERSGGGDGRAFEPLGRGVRVRIEDRGGRIPITGQK